MEGLIAGWREPLTRPQYPWPPPPCPVPLALPTEQVTDVSGADIVLAVRKLERRALDDDPRPALRIAGRLSRSCGVVSAALRILTRGRMPKALAITIRRLMIHTRSIAPRTCPS